MSGDINMSIEEICKISRSAANRMRMIPHISRQSVLAACRDSLISHRASILEANRYDMEQACNLDTPIRSRLLFDDKKLDATLVGIDQIIELADPIGRCTLANKISKGMNLYRITCPIGVLAIIYEARPEAGIQIAMLCIKSANAVILKGGKEAQKTNAAIYAALRDGIRKIPDIPHDIIQILHRREDIAQLLKLDQYVDLVIPRGSRSLIQYINENTRIPVLGHADGLCIIFVDESADIQRSIDVIIDAKTNYPAACNAVETILVHSSLLSIFLPLLGNRLKAANVEIRADPACMAYLESYGAICAKTEDWMTEFLSLTIAIASVSNIEEAIQWINLKGSHHTDAILTENDSHAKLFVQSVDSSSVYVNCSTRFADGYRYGFGAEVGISTNRLHSRGPVGLDGLVIYNYRIYGEYNTLTQWNAQDRKFEFTPIFPELKHSIGVDQIENIQLKLRTNTNTN